MYYFSTSLRLHCNLQDKLYFTVESIYISNVTQEGNTPKLIYLLYVLIICVVILYWHQGCLPNLTYEIWFNFQPWLLQILHFYISHQLAWNISLLTHSKKRFAILLATLLFTFQYIYYENQKIIEPRASISKTYTHLWFDNPCAFLHPLRMTRRPESQFVKFNL